MKFQKILAWGDSFTFGDELPQEEFWTRAPENIKDLITRLQSGAAPKEEDYTLYYNWIRNEPDYERRCKQSSWAALVASQLNLPFENHAICGASLDQIDLQMQDYLDQVDDALVLIGVPIPGRHTRWHQGNWQSENLEFLLKTGLPQNAETIELVDTWLLDDFVVSWQTICTLNCMVNTLEQHGATVLIYDTFGLLDHVNRHSTLYNDFYQAANKLIVPMSSLHRIMSIFNFKRCLFQHPPKSAHAIAAREITEFIYDEYGNS